MNFKQYFTESKRKKVVDQGSLDLLEKQLLRKWRNNLKVGDIVDIYHNNGELWIPDASIIEIEKLMAVNTEYYKNYQMEDLFIEAGPVGVNACHIYPVGYKPGDITKKEAEKHNISPEQVITIHRI
jgi:hypothetical protein